MHLPAPICLGPGSRASDVTSAGDASAAPPAGGVLRGYFWSVVVAWPMFSWLVVSCPILS